MSWKNKKLEDFLEEVSSYLYDPRGLPNNGQIKKNDFVFMREGLGWIFFLKPNDSEKEPKRIQDGKPKFVKKSYALKAFGTRTIESSLEFSAKRMGFSLKKIKARNKKDKIWQFC